MKTAAYFLVLMLSTFASYTQSSDYHFTEEFYFVKEVPVLGLTGKNFRFEIAVKILPADTLSKVRVHGISVGMGEEDFLNSNFSVESRIEQDWTIYTVIGKVQELAKKIWFYSSVNGNGDFYFDDICFYIEEVDGRWKQLHLYNASFEEKSQDIFSGYFVSKRKSPKLRTMITRDVYKTGKQSLRVRSSGQSPVMPFNTVRI